MKPLQAYWASLSRWLTRAPRYSASGARTRWAACLAGIILAAVIFVVLAIPKHVGMLSSDLVDALRWGVLAVAFGWAVVLDVQNPLHRAKDGKPYCGRCGYSLSGIELERCPECGLDFRSGERVAVGTPVEPSLIGMAVSLVAVSCAWNGIWVIIERWLP